MVDAADVYSSNFRCVTILFFTDSYAFLTVLMLRAVETSNVIRENPLPKYFPGRST
jgi:hypothetical protein